MNSVSDLTPESKMVWVLGLMIECPFGKAQEDCPMNTARKLPLEERVALAKQMEESRLDELITHHMHCLKEREGGQVQ